MSKKYYNKSNKKINGRKLVAIFIGIAMICSVIPFFLMKL
ncbi:hypothetical protein Metok_1259 [Methanothermococcus okinawensis IH1]|uniref:Uncharacterized protein n=1 Tax=Methanothermococcus okinawensis (strain DSM 14208 / JCM 11175 / IH1) TaxID=647113 RepID=F8ALK7_METOI|nr:hypothetical protein Metok_1259 [Methanothermococcus okinawensis IH1]